MTTNDKTSFHYPELGISVAYHPEDEAYVVSKVGRKLVKDKSAGVCLEVARNRVLDDFSAEIIPMWERGADEGIDQAAE